jgi:hypothetical protein
MSAHVDRPHVIEELAVENLGIQRRLVERGVRNLGDEAGVVGLVGVGIVGLHLEEPTA